MDDTLYAQYVEYLTSGSYPEFLPPEATREHKKNAKRAFRESAKRYDLRNGKLRHKGKQVVLKSEVQHILFTVHDDPLSGGHLGRDKTLKKVSVQRALSCGFSCAIV